MHKPEETQKKTFKNLQKLSKTIKNHQKPPETSETNVINRRKSNEVSSATAKNRFLPSSFPLISLTIFNQKTQGEA
jgi:hypothetical protein